MHRHFIRKGALLTMPATFTLAQRADALRAIPTLLLVAATFFGVGCNSDGTTSPDGTKQPPGLATSTTLIPILPGQSIQAKVNSYPAGTRFLIKKGTYYNQQVLPKTGNWFVGELGAILDGKGTALYAFQQDSTHFPSSVHIKGLIIQHYASPDQYGAILAGDPKYGNTVGWIVENC